MNSRSSVWQRPDPPDPARAGRLNVLVIDDSESARKTMASRLSAAGYCVYELASAIGATRTILRNRIGAVIVDVSMPGLSGDKLVGVLRRNASLSALVIIVTSTDVRCLEQIAGDSNVDAVLPKNRVSEELVRLLQYHLAARRLWAPNAAE
jgi:DNA-binding response OmpR family regulator